MRVELWPGPLTGQLNGCRLQRMGVTRSWRIFISLADKFDWLFYSSGPYFLLKRIRSQQNFFLSKPCKLLRGLFVNFSLKISLRGRNFSGTSLPRYRENTFGHTYVVYQCILWSNFVLLKETTPFLIHSLPKLFQSTPSPRQRWTVQTNAI